VAPSGLCGLTVRRDANGFRSVVYQDTAPTGWHAAHLAPDEETINGYDDLFASRFVGPASAPARITSQAGQIVQLLGTGATLGDTVLLSVFASGAEVRLDSVDHMHFKTPTGKYMLFEAAGACSILSSDTSLYGAGSLRLQLNGTGIGFFAKSPVAQQADTVALTDSSGGAVDGTIAAVSGSGADATINNNFADLAAKYNALRTLLRNYGLMA
jgi:hypothetical protein